jgi:phosphoenolpyruvate carboxykinase (ATP)
LAEKASQNGASIWLLNTGWIRGYGQSDRFPISVSRAILRAIQSGSLANAPMTRHPVFGFDVPQACVGVESKWLEIPHGSQVELLAERFRENFRRYETFVDPQILVKGGPKGTVSTAQEAPLEVSH